MLGLILKRTSDRLVAQAKADACKHQWKVTGATFAPPSRGGWSTTGWTPEGLIDELLHGITTVTQQCQVCSKVNSYVVPGQAELPGYRWKAVA